MLFSAGALWPKTVGADTLPKNQVIFSEIFLGNPSPNAGQEFIELYNNTYADLDLAGWHVQYTSATKTDWSSPSRNIALSGTIAAGDYYLLTSTGYLSNLAKLTFSSTLSQTGGHLRILDKSGVLQDQIGWGNAAMPLGTAVQAPDAGNSLARLSNAAGYNITGDNSTDFTASTTSTPGEENTITAPVVPGDDNGGSTDPGGSTQPPSTTPPVTIAYLDVQISEILPNPASPQTDANDEYVELYNPNDSDVDLSGYIIETGVTTTHQYAINGATIPAGSYYIFTSGTTTLSLSNSSGQVKLLAPDLSQLDQSDPYANAPDGQAWIFDGSNWVWTATPTPNAANIFTAPPVKAGKVKAASIKKASAKQPKKAATKAKKKSTKATKPLAKAAAATNPPAKVHPVVLASVGSGALLYAMYEYRTDLGSNIYRLRRYRETWAGSWGATAAATGSRVAGRLGRWQNHLRSWFSARFGK